MGPRLAPFRAAAGIASGIASLAALLATCAQWVPHGGALNLVAQLVFAAFLLRCAWRSLRHARGPATASGRNSPHYFRSGFLTALSNPFTLAFLTATCGTLNGYAAAGVVFVVAGLWFTIIALAFCRPWVRRVYARHERAVQTAFGLSFLAMGLRTAAQAMS
jgi:amino acid exporter